MKKIGKALALGDLLLCLALVAVYGFTGGLKWQQTAAVREMEGEEEEEKEIRRIAITFDDEDIIGSSQRDAVKKRFL